MPLVSSNIVSAWYKRDSSVYKNLAYLWANPLWNKKMPNGFSLCPMWWLSMFSLFIFRPFVALILTFRALIKFCRLDKAMITFEDKWLQRAAGVPRGIPTFAASVVLTTVGIILFGLSRAAMEYYEAGVLSSLIMAVTLLVTFLCCGLYAESHKTPDRCPVEIYTRVMSVAFVIIAFLVNPIYAHFSFVEFPWDVVSTIGGGIWSAIVWVGSSLGHIISWIFGGAVFSMWVYLLAIPAFLLLGLLFEKITMRYLWNDTATWIKTYTEVKWSAKEIKIRIGTILATIEVWMVNTEGVSTLPDGWKDFADECPEVIRLAEDSVELEYNQIAAIAPVTIQFAQAAMAARSEAQRLRDEACKKFTAKMTKVFSPVIAVWKQVRILSSYLWQFAKAKKSKSCPYLIFTD